MSQDLYHTAVGLADKQRLVAIASSAAQLRWLISHRDQPQLAALLPPGPILGHNGVSQAGTAVRIPPCMAVYPLQASQENTSHSISMPSL